MSILVFESAGGWLRVLVKKWAVDLLYDGFNG
jgi:hypothetical protein